MCPVIRLAINNFTRKYLVYLPNYILELTMQGMWWIVMFNAILVYVVDLIS